MEDNIHRVDFSYLEKFVGNESAQFPENRFFSLKENDIIKNEKRLNIHFPSELKQFFLEIGYGFLNKNDGVYKKSFHINRIIDPNSIADIMLLGVDSGQLHPDAEFRPGYMPFFEIGEAIDFFFLQPLSDKPNIVYDLDGSIVEKSFSKFIWRLYYESPSFYIKEEYIP